MPFETLTPPRLGNTRVTGKEQFYTPKDLAIELVAEVEKTLGPLVGKTILEPAGGTGSFIEAVEKVGAKKILSFDIEPLHPKVSEGSFLNQDIAEVGVITISNPPFGRNNALSVPFFNHAASFSEAICFIVPRSWRKWSVTNRLDMNFEPILDVDLDIDYVDAHGELLSTKSRLATCFQVWRKTKTPRVPIRIKDMGIVQKVAPAEADVSLTIFGYGCGKLRSEFKSAANTTQLFLKLVHPDALAALGKVDFSKFYKNTAYTEALSLQEINYLLNEEIFGDPMMESSN